MKRTIFIASGSIVLIIIFSIWVFLLLFGAPKNIEEAFTTFGLDGEPTPIDPNANFSLEQIAKLNINSGSLAQLTTRQVAGHGFGVVGSTTDKLWYAERGVGHIYEVDIATGVESRTSAKTFLAVTDAEFSPDGKFVVFVSETENGTSATLENLDGETGYDIPSNASNLKFVSNNELRYTVTNASTTIGYSLNLEEMTTDQIFSVPLLDINTVWTDAETLIINKPAPRLRGALLRVENNQLSRIGESGYALSAIVPSIKSGEYLLTRANLDRSGALSSIIFNELSGESRPLAILAWPEKCTFDLQIQNTLWCAASAAELSRESHSSWYKGTVSFSDLLWKVDTLTGAATLTENLSQGSGRNVDVTDLQVDQSGKLLLFKNKLDNTLWLKKVE